VLHKYEELELSCQALLFEEKLSKVFSIEKCYIIIKKPHCSFVVYASYTGMLMCITTGTLVCSNGSALPSCMAAVDLVVLNNMKNMLFHPACMSSYRRHLATEVKFVIQRLEQ